MFHLFQISNALKFKDYYPKQNNHRLRNIPFIEDLLGIDIEIVVNEDIAEAFCSRPIDFGISLEKNALCILVHILQTFINGQCAASKRDSSYLASERYRHDNEAFLLNLASYEITRKDQDLSPDTDVNVTVTAQLTTCGRTKDAKRQ